MNQESTLDFLRANKVQPAAPFTKERRLRVLVTIANYGTKNSLLLKHVIRRWREMTQFDVTIVVTTEADRHFEEGVEVVVGLPSQDPWSLPFAHKKILADRLHDHDLFVYSEDDIEVTQAHLQAFLEVTAMLPENEIAGFLRYEKGSDGARSYPDVHSFFHWNPLGVQRIGADVFAYFTNEHAAFYVLTAAQLKCAIESGGFLRAPYEGHYDMACSAATDPYTSCGFRKVVCISRLDAFSIRHLSDRYVDSMGIGAEELKQHVQAQIKIADGQLTNEKLLNAVSRMTRGEWSKDYYEMPDETVVQAIPQSVRTLLSVGCGWGATESLLQERGVAVTALPLDTVIGASVSSRGMEVINGSLMNALSALEGRRFNGLLIADLLHLQQEPHGLLELCLKFLARQGIAVIKGPHFSSLRVIAKRVMKRHEYEKLRSYDESGIHMLGPTSVAGTLRRHGIGKISTRWIARSSYGRNCRQSNRWQATEWILSGELAS